MMSTKFLILLINSIIYVSRGEKVQDKFFITRKGENISCVTNTNKGLVWNSVLDAEAVKKQGNTNTVFHKKNSTK